MHTLYLVTIGCLLAVLTVAVFSAARSAHKLGEVRQACAALLHLAQTTKPTITRNRAIDARNQHALGVAEGRHGAARLVLRAMDGES